MRKFYAILALGIFFAAGTVSCTPEKLEEESELYQTDKPQVCPPHDRNCNGIPDDQE